MGNRTSDFILGAKKCKVMNPVNVVFEPFGDFSSA